AVLRRVWRGTSRWASPAKSAPATPGGFRRSAPWPAAPSPLPRSLPASLAGRAFRRTSWPPPATSRRCRDGQSDSFWLPQIFDDLLHQRIRVALMFGNLGGIARGLAFAEVIRQHPLEKRVAQHLGDALAPVVDAACAGAAVLLQISAILFDCRQQFGSAGTSAGHGLHDGRRPTVFAHGQRLHGANLALHSLGAIAVRLVDDENVGDLHDAGLDGLHNVAHAGHQHDDGHIRQAHDVHLVLADADGLDHDNIAAAGVAHRRDIGSGAGQPAQRAARGHAANVNSGIGGVRLHANAVAKNCAAAERAGGIDSDDANRLPLLAVRVCYLVHQRALARAWRARHAQQYGLAAIGKQRLQQFGGLRAVVFDDGDATRQSPRLSRADSPDKFLDVAVRGQELVYQQTRLPAGEGVRVSYSSPNARPDCKSRS